MAGSSLYQGIHTLKNWDETYVDPRKNRGTGNTRPSLDEPVDAISGAAPSLPRTASMERYSEAYIGLLSNNAFYQFMQSLSGPEGESSDEARSVMSMRRNWFWDQRTAYGRSSSGAAGPKQQEALNVFVKQAGGTGGKIVLMYAAGSGGDYTPRDSAGQWELYRMLQKKGAIDENGKIVSRLFTDGSHQVELRHVSAPSKKHDGTMGAPKVRIRFSSLGRGYKNGPPEDSSFVTQGSAEGNGAVRADKWVRLFKGLQTFSKEWNLATYNSWLPMAVGLVGNMDNDGYITANPARSYSEPELAFAAELVRYHYADMGGGANGNTYSSYQRNVLLRAKELLGRGGWADKFTDGTDPRFDYVTATMDDLDTDPTELGSMANAYNRMVAENFTAISNCLLWGGIDISGEKGISPATLREYIDQMESRVAGEGSSGYLDSVIEEVEGYYGEWYQYKTGVNNIYAVAQRLEGEDWADFIIAYCGAESEESVKELWPWWEPKSDMEQKLNKAQDMKDFYDSMREQKQDMRDAGYVDIPNRGNTREEDEDEKQTGGAGRGGVGVSWGTPQSEKRDNWSNQGADF